MAATASAPKNSTSLRRAAFSARSTCICSDAQLGELAIDRLEGLERQAEERGLVALDGIEPRLDVLAAALQLGDLVVARVLEGFFEGLEAPRTVRLLGHLGDRLAGFLELALQARHRPVDAVELNGGLGHEPVPADPLAIRC